MLAACADASPESGLDVERITRGDTLIVRTIGGSVWDTSPALVEEIRIGSLDGRDEEMFGVVSRLAPDGRGGVYVFDGRAPALRHYDATGEYTTTFGAEGSGPGEYRDAALGLSVLRDSRVLLYDPRNARINVYAPDGTPVDHWMVASGLFTQNTMVVDTGGEIYIKTLLGRPEPNRPWPIGLLHLSATGELVDTIPPPQLDGEPETAQGTFGVSKAWEMSPLGYLIAGINSSYSFELREADGSVVRVEKVHSPVSVQPEERSEWEARNEWTRRAQSQFLTAEIPPVPGVKPAYRGFDIGADGEIWVRTYTDARKVDVEPPSTQSGGPQPPPPSLSWREPIVYDVFDPGGTYFGQVRMPERVSLAAHRGTEVWGIMSGEFDELYVVRYRLVVPNPN
jgi:hypothetical protein